jgi:hypothetical protein
VKAPQYGFSDRDLTTYFQRIYKPATRTPTRTLPSPTSASTLTSSPPSSPQKSNIGATAGGAVGGAVFVLGVVALLVWLCMRQRQRSAAAAIYQQNDLYQHHSKQPSQDMQEHQHIPPGELTGESLHELPTALSPTMSKSGINYQIHSLSSATPSTTYSPPHSPSHSPLQSPPLAPAMHSASYSYQGQNHSVPYAVIPPYQPQTYDQQSRHPYPIQQPHTPLQPIYSQPPPQQQYTPPPLQNYSLPPQDDASNMQAPDVRRPSNPASTTTVRRREVGSVSSTRTSPGPRPIYENEPEGR